MLRAREEPGLYLVDPSYLWVDESKLKVDLSVFLHLETQVI